MRQESQKDTYSAWVERMAAGREGKPLTAGEQVEASPGEPYQSIQFARTEREHYVGEVGKRGDEYIFHFFPKEPFNGIKEEEDGTRTYSLEALTFEEKMGDVFLEVFKNPNQLQADWTHEHKSWAVKVTGFVNTLWGDDQAISIFDRLDKALASL